MCFRVVVSIDYISFSRCLHRAFQNNSQTFDIIIVETKPQYIRVSNRTVFKNYIVLFRMQKLSVNLEIQIPT